MLMLAVDNTTEHMTLGRRKNIHLATVQSAKKSLDDALISLFSPIHEIFRVFCDAGKM